MRRKRRFRRLVYFVVGLFLAYIAVCWYLSGQYLSPPREAAGPLPDFDNDAMIETKGGPNPTWVSKNIDSAPVVFVMAYGNGGVRSSFSDLARDLIAHGYATVVPCMPGQDASPEPRIGFGVTESRTLLDTVRWVRSKRPDHPKVILYGVSMGGAASWLSVVSDPPVDGIVTESAYAELAPTVEQFFNRSLPGGSVIFRPVVWFAQWRSGRRVVDVVPARPAMLWQGRPALIIQAGDDRLVLPKQGEELAGVTGGEYWLIPGAVHANCYEHDPKAYVGRLVEFVETRCGTRR